MKQQVAQEGFTAIELLITLLIASMFILSGYQLYAQVNRDGADANRSANVSALVTAKVQSEARSVTGTGNCVQVGPTSLGPVNEPGVGNVTYVTNVTCPSPTELTTLKYIKVEATYGSNPVRKIFHGTYTK